MNDHTIKVFLAASADLLQAAIHQAAAEDPEGYAHLQACIRAGGLLTVRADMSPTTGIAQIGIDVTEPSGATHRLMGATLEKMRAQ